MDGPLIERFKYWYGDGLPVDGWVAVDNGHMFIELFPRAIHDLKLREGDYVRVSVIRKEDIDDPTKRPKAPINGDTDSGISGGLSTRPYIRSG